MQNNLRQMYGVGLMAFIIFLSNLASVPVMPQLSTELGAETTQIPIVVSAALATVVLVQFFTGILADLMGISALFSFGIFYSFVPTKSQLIGLKAWQIGAILSSAFDSVMDLSLFIGPLIAISAYKSVGHIAPVFLIAVIPAALAFFATIIWLPRESSK